MTESTGGKLTPLMQQYWEIKNQHQDKVLLFRMGDFFEMFHQDAEIAAPIIGIALTCRNKKAADETKMCGVPHHSIAGPIGKLLAAGKKVAICDQIEDPRLAKGIVKRAVTRVISPGMVYDPDTLDELSANYLASYDEDSVSFLDTSSGEAFFYRAPHLKERLRLLALLAPKELVLSSRDKQEALKHHTESPYHLSASEELTEDSQWPKSARRLLAYARKMQGAELVQTIRPFEERECRRHMELSATTLQHLEVMTTQKGERQGSLLHAIQRTQTAGGGRLLKEWLRFPLYQEAALLERWDQVSFWQARPVELKRLREELAQLGDLERRIGKIANPNANARDLMSLAASLRVALNLSQFIQDRKLEVSSLDRAAELLEVLEKTLVEAPPLAVKEGGMIRTGVDRRLDELIDLDQNAGKKLVELESRERESTGIASLKVRYNNVFGYYIEITKTHQEKAPSHYLRKQTLANAERFTTAELQALEEKVLSAQSQRSELEYQIFQDLRAKVLARAVEMLHIARAMCELDVLSSFAWLAIEQKYVRPQIARGGELILLNSRHPVVEQELSVRFVPNSISLAPGECMILTGPNMAGKSTLMRQVALAVLMAQAGCFVAAESARLPLFERIFTRIGASDALNEGLSTFMVEMKEAAEILREASPKSLVILDEIGRGTSTYDGMSLAQAILEYLVKEKQSMTLFATHYHELTQVQFQLPRVKNAHMSIQERGGEVSFLHTLAEGPANKSYGIHVGKLAGLPAAVIQRAKALLIKLESLQPQGFGQLSLADAISDQLPPQEGLSEAELELIAKLKSLPVQKMTPLEALNQLAQWQQNLS